jgi:xanthine dehydrogenase YagS FAD-binding subunit
MKAFEYTSPRDLKQASDQLGNDYSRAKLLAGGIDLLSEMKERIIEPDRVVNLKSVTGLNHLEAGLQGLRLGALVTLTEIEEHPVIRRSYAALAQAANSVASPQIRNVGTIGGNLCQRPRCWYYRDEGIQCIKKGGSKCYAAEGKNKFNAILGGGPSYIVHPSDCAPALLALNGRVTIAGPGGKTRQIPLEEFFVLPRVNVFRENVLQANEIVTAIDVPTPAPGTRSTYLKFKERDSMDWALSAVGAALTMQNGVVGDARIVLGGVAPIPWRSKEAEAVLRGKAVTPALADQAAEAALADAKPLADNGYKVPLTKVLIRRAVLACAGGKG